MMFGSYPPVIRNKKLTVITEYYDQDDKYRSSTDPLYMGAYSEMEVDKEIKFQKGVIDECIKHKTFDEVGLEYLDCYVEREDRSFDVVILHVQIKVKVV